MMNGRRAFAITAMATALSALVAFALGSRPLWIFVAAGCTYVAAGVLIITACILFQLDVGAESVVPGANEPADSSLDTVPGPLPLPASTAPVKSDERARNKRNIPVRPCDRAQTALESQKRFENQPRWSGVLQPDRCPRCAGPHHVERCPAPHLR